MRHNIKTILNKWWLILLLGIVSAGASICLDFFNIGKTYEASTALFVFQIIDSPHSSSKVENAYQNLMASEMLIQDYREIVKTDIVINRLIDQLKSEGLSENITYDDIIRNVEVNVKRGTRIIEISMRHKDPEAAARIVNILAQTLIKESECLTNIKSISILSTARAAEKPAGPNTLLSALFFAAAGMVAGVAAILFMDYVRYEVMKR